MTLPTAVILDMDGSLVDVTTALRHVATKPKDYHQFHIDSGTCPPHQQALDYTQTAVDNGHRLVILTGRQDRYRTLTTTWLMNNLTPTQFATIDAIVMRDNDDYSSAPAFKYEAYKQITQHYTIVGAIDDDPRIIDLWRSLNIPNVLEIPRSPDDPSRGTSDTAALIDDANQKA